MIKAATFFRFSPFLLVGFLLFAGTKAKASHAMGSDIAYECIDPINRIYKVTVNFYRDCAGFVDAPFTMQLNVSSLSCGQNFNVDLTQLPLVPNPNGGKPGEVSPLCSSEIGKSACNGGTLPGVERYTYEGNVTLPMACSDWVLSISVSARNDQITNLLNASTQALYVQTTLDNVTYNNNRSPVFTTLPVPFICANQPFSYNHGAVDADGDSLVFSLVNALGFGGAPIDYNFPFTPTVPMATTGGFNFNTATGQMNFTPSGIQVAVVTILVKEYRNGLQIGTTMRDIQIVVVNIAGCSSPTPFFTGNISGSVQGGFPVDSSLVQVCPNVTLSFGTNAFDRNGDSLFMESNVAQAIPGAQFNITRLSKDSLRSSFSWTPSITDTGRHTFIIIVKNNHCPLANSQAYAITIDVLSGTVAGPDMYYCPAGGAVKLEAYGGSEFTWSPDLFLDDPNSPTPMASPRQTTVYVVTSNLSSTCKNRDSVTVFRVPDFDFTLTQSKDTICRNDIVQFMVSADSANAPYKFEWTPAAGMSSTTTANPYAQPASTTDYQVVITSEKTGCARKDTGRIVVGGGIGPQVFITADKDNVCAGDTIRLQSLISTVTCGVTNEPCTGQLSTFLIGSDTLRSQGPNTPYNNFYSGSRVQMLFLASELKAMGMTPGSIRSVGFEVATKRSSNPFFGFNIRMSCTDKESVSAFTAGLTTVFSAAQYNSTSGVNTHTLNTPFNWDGISNLLVEVCFSNNQDLISSDDIVRVSRTTFTSMISAYADGLIGCVLPMPGSNISLSSNRPNIRFGYCTAPPPDVDHIWSPSTNLFTPDVLDPFVVMGQNSTTYFLTATDSACEGSRGITLHIDTTFSISAGPDLPICDGLGVQLGVAINGLPPREEIIGCNLSSPGCAETPVQKELNRSNLQSSTNSLFGGASNGSVKSERAQILYHASDLLAAGFTRGTISKIGFRLASKNTTRPFDNFNIGLGCTDKITLNDVVWDSTVNVFSTPSYSTVTSWNDFTLQSNFEWDGKKNLLVEVCWTKTDSAQNVTDPIIVSNVAYTSLHIGTDDSIPGCEIPAPTFRIYTQLPEIRMTLCPPPLLPVTYRWSPATGSNDTIANPFVNPQHNTTYTVITFFGGKCPKVDTIIVRPRNVVPVISEDTVICLGNAVQLSASGADIYRWSPATGLDCTDCSNPTANPTETTTYYVTVTDAATGCNRTDSVVVVVEDLTVVPLFTDTIVDIGTPVTLGATVQGGNGDYVYQWTPATFLNNATSPNPVSTPEADIIYTLQVSSGVCTDTAQINVVMTRKEDNIEMPDAFTPNGDTRNDFFGPVTQYNVATIKSFRIYNRYGQLVHDANTPWDGKFQGVDQPVGTYVYYIVMQIPFFPDQPKHGSVTLLR